MLCIDEFDIIKNKMKQFIKNFFSINCISLKKFKPISNKFGFDRGSPIDRYYIESWIKKNQQFIKGNLLEIAEDTYCRKFSIKEKDTDSNIFYP